MRRNPIFPLLATSAFLTLFALQAQAAEQARSVAPFTQVSNSGPISISIDVGKAQSVTASGNDTFINQLTTEVVDGELRIKLRDHAVNGSLGDPKIVITVPQLTRFTMAGAGATTITHMSGDKLDLNYSGAGSLKADGNVKALSLMVGGVGSIDTRELHAQTATVTVGGVGSVRVYASERLDAAVGGVGSLTYYGNPKTVNSTGGGLGSISPAH
jgi:hypothetical protein